MVDRYGRPIRGREGATPRGQRPQRPQQQPARQPRQTGGEQQPRQGQPRQSGRPQQYIPDPAESQHYYETQQLGRDGVPMGQRRQSQGQRRPRTAGQGQRQGQGRRNPQQRSGQRAPQRRPQQRRRPAGNQSPWGNLGNFRLPRLRPRGCLSGLAWTLVVVLVLAVAGTFWLDSRLNRVAADPPQHIAATSGTNWLLVGSDSRTGLSEADAQRLGTGGDIGSMRTDTIMLLHIPLTGKATLVSLPRDSYVNIPGYGMDKINAAFTFGGPQLLTQTVEEATGLRIKHYAEIGMGGLANVVDAVSGIEVCPKEPIQDPLAHLDVQAGCQKVDGPTALGYVRTRATAMGDLDRVQRQREFFAALVKKVSSAGTLANPFRLLPTITTVTGSFTVGEKDHVWNLARVALAMRSGVTTETVPVGGFGNYDVGSVVLWDEEGSQQLFNSLK
ncbi:LCP family protein [Corynebacterium matruchotii]|uniref:LCP family protein n=1 Tax=Corynebacterium matruchotii TaxID=43768 RepID=UPI0028E7B8B1|nr:LCP family protein [Corynebacterium matruchotii]